MLLNKLKYIVLFLICLPNNVAGQHTHNVLLWGEGGYNSILTNSDLLQSQGGIGYGAGLGYEFNYKKFVFQTGAGISKNNSAFLMNDFVYSTPLVDSEGDNYTGNFNFSDTEENYDFTNINIPIMVGFRSKKVFLLAGVKAGFNLSGHTKLTTTITSTGIYSQFIDDFENMPDHYFYTESEQYNYPAALALNVSAAFEAGFLLGKYIEGRPTYRLSAYVDYGLKNIHNNEFSNNLVFPKAETSVFEPQLNSFLLSNIFQTKDLSSIMVGVRLTVRFGIQGPADCKCDFYHDYSKRPKAKRRY
jgi:hypothetical protein